MDDWSSRITALEAEAWSLTRIAEEIGLSLSSVSDIKRRSTIEPKGMAAVRLHALHARVCAPVDSSVESG